MVVVVVGATVVVVVVEAVVVVGAPNLPNKLKLKGNNPSKPRPTLPRPVFAPMLALVLSPKLKNGNAV